MTVSVPVLDDGDNEEAETLTLTLSNASGAGAVIRIESATGTIEDDRGGGRTDAKFVNVPAEPRRDGVRLRTRVQRRGRGERGDAARSCLHGHRRCGDGGGQG